jgi:polyisoprenyl-teichoic acid--peptidoglycan teichoic acid transferase
MWQERRSLAHALGLTVASAAVWGLAHIVCGRTRTGLALATVHITLLATASAAVTVLRPAVFALLARPDRLSILIITTLAVALCWIAVIVRSFQLCVPGDLDGVRRGISACVLGLLCVAVALPLAYAGRVAYVSRDMLTTIFQSGAGQPWAGRERLNVLLLGADAAKRRPGARTDSVTVASIDTGTGQTVLFGLPRNLQRVPMPAGPARIAFPFGFTGGGTALSPGLLNEVYQWGDEHPELVPGAPPGRSGITLLRETVGGILGLPMHYYAMVDMRGFQDIVDAMGGVTITIRQDIPYGREGGVLRAGTRRLDGEQALWYGRARTGSDDYTRMGRQKCLLGALVRQAGPVSVLRGFERVAAAAKKYVSTDVPREALPDVLELFGKVQRARIRSLPFVPPMIDTASPDWYLIRRRVAEELAKPARSGGRGNTAQPLDAIC